MACLSGMIRGRRATALPVTMRTKIVEIDPRGASAEVRGIAE